MKEAESRLTRLLGGEVLKPLRLQLRRRFEREDLDAPLREIRLSGLAPHERDALAQIVGSRPSSSASIVLDLAVVDSMLSAAGVAPSLRAGLEQLDGPILHRASVRDADAARWSEATSAVAHPQLLRWISLPSNRGLLKRLSSSDHIRAAQICTEAETVLNHLPANGTTLARLAADALGDAHALDAGRAVATVVINAVRNSEEPDRDVPLADDDRVRSVWARVGVMVNELARPALFLNVPFAVTDGSASPATGHPSYASLRWLMRSTPRWDVRGQDVFVCENPNIVTIAADHLGGDCRPLVCTEGMPAAAQRIMLAELRRAGAVLRYHGDFDWSGIRIANLVVREHGAVPWQMSAHDFDAAIGCTQGRGAKLSGDAVTATWEPDLSKRMIDHGLAIPEEAVVAALLADLAGARSFS